MEEEVTAEPTKKSGAQSTRTAGLPGLTMEPTKASIASVAKSGKPAAAMANVKVNKSEKFKHRNFNPEEAPNAPEDPPPFGAPLNFYSVRY